MLAVTRCQLRRLKTYFFQGFLRFSVNRKILHEAQEALPGLHNSQAGASGKHKEFQRFQWNSSVVPRRALGTSLGCCYALPALEAGNHAFSIDFQGFSLTIRFNDFSGRRPQPHFAEKACFPNVFAYVSFLGRNVFSWQVVLNPLEM